MSAEQKHSPARKWILLGLQLIVSVALLVWIFHDREFRAHFWQVVRAGQWDWLLLGFIVAGVSNVLGAFRWRIFLHVLKMPLGVWDALRLSFIGLFFNNFLPGAVGGDAVKVVWLVTKGHRDSSALVSVFMDRMSGFFALVACSLALILSRYDWLTSSPTVAALTKSVFAFLAVMAFLLALSFVAASPFVRRRVPQWMPLREKMLSFNADYFEFVRVWPQTLRAALLSAVMMAAHFLTFYCAARAFDVNLPLMDFLSLMPAVDIISAMPVSFGGLGVREALLERLLGELAGVPAAQAISVSLAGALLNMVWGLAGVFLIPSYRDLVSKAVKQ